MHQWHSHPFLHHRITNANPEKLRPAAPPQAMLLIRITITEPTEHGLDYEYIYYVHTQHFQRMFPLMNGSFHSQDFKRHYNVEGDTNVARNILNNVVNIGYIHSSTMRSYETFEVPMGYVVSNIFELYGC